jgi:hypothetical protein
VESGNEDEQYTEYDNLTDELLSLEKDVNCLFVTVCNQNSKGRGQKRKNQNGAERTRWSCNSRCGNRNDAK